MKPLKVLAIVAASVFFIGYFLDSLAQIPDLLVDNFKILSEFFSVFMSLSIFTVTWYAYSKSRDNHALFMGTAFLVIGLLDLFHVLSYPFMPDFITLNSQEKSAFFWNAARLISAILFLASAYIYKDTLPWLLNKQVLFFSAMVLSSVIFFTGIFYPGNLITAYISESSFSIAKAFQILIAAIILLYASYLYTKRKMGKDAEVFLIYGFITVLLSDLVYFSYEISGHLLKIVGFYLIYLAMYRSSIEMPYEKLAIAEEKLRIAAEDKYRRLVLNIPDVTWTSDSAGKTTFISPNVEKVYGFTPEEIYQGGEELWFGRIHPDDVENVKEAYESLFFKNMKFDVEYRIQKKDGKWIWLHDRAIATYEKEGIKYADGLFSDITEGKKAEELRREYERLTIADGLRSNFFAVMSHELRTPLNGIVGFSELLKQKIAGELNEKQEKFVDNIQTSAQRQLSIIENILELTRMETEKIELAIEKVHVVEIINSALDFIKEKAAEHKVVIKKDLDPELEFIESDMQKLKLILYNLLDNTVKFSKLKGGAVTVATKKEGEMAKISVSDTGIGIKEEDIKRLFKEFEQLDSGISRKYGGTGLGLAISKKLVELHGGKITAESRYGEGSTFTILLPIKAKKKEEKK